MQQNPCPDRVVDDMGGAFVMGAVGGSLWHFIKGYRNSPKGYAVRGGINSMAFRAPTTGASFAMWGGLFATYDCAIVWVRRKEDPWNAVLAGASTGATLAFRSGIKSMGKNAFIGGMLLGMFEGLGALASKFMAPPTQMPAPQPLSQAPQMGFLSPLAKAADSKPRFQNGFSPDYALQEMQLQVFDDTDMVNLAQDIENEASRIYM